MFEGLTFERFYAGSQAFRDNIRFLSQFRLSTIFHHIIDDIEREKHIMETLQDESDALTAEETTVAALVKDVADEITKFQAASAAGVDTTPFVTRINALNTSLQAVDASALAAVPTVPVALPPASPAAPTS